MMRGDAAQEAVRDAVGAPAGPPPFAWHDRDALAELFAPYGFDITVAEERLAFTANSPRDYLDAESDNHPLAVAGRAVLEPRGEATALRVPHALDLRSGQQGSGRLPRHEPLHRGDGAAPAVTAGRCDERLGSAARREVGFCAVQKKAAFSDAWQPPLQTTSARERNPETPALTARRAFRRLAVASCSARPHSRPLRLLLRNEAVAQSREKVTVPVMVERDGPSSPHLEPLSQSKRVVLGVTNSVIPPTN